MLTLKPLLPTNCLSATDHFVGLALKGLKYDRALLTVAGMEIWVFLQASFSLQVTSMQHVPTKKLLYVLRVTYCPTYPNFEHTWFSTKVFQKKNKKKKQF